MENLLMGGSAMGAQPQQARPQQPPQPQQAPRPTPEQIVAARAHMGIVMRGLLGLAAQPKGSLTKRSLFNAVGDMISEGAFSTPEARQQLVAQLAEMPDDEAAIRKAIGEQLMRMGEMSEQFGQHFPEEVPNG